MIEPAQPAAYPSYLSQEPEKAPEPEPAPVYEAPAPAYPASEPEPEEPVEIPEVRPIKLTLDPTPDPAWGESEASARISPPFRPSGVAPVSAPPGWWAETEMALGLSVSP